jgi:hypothetical protein
VAPLHSLDPSSSVAVTAPEEPQLFLGGYWLLSQLALGELCTIHRARSIVAAYDRTEVAVKRLRADQVEARGRAREQHHDGTARARLLREARLGLSLRSPQLVRVLEIHDEPELFVVMEYIEGATLRELSLRAPKGEALRYLVPMFIDVLGGLSALHNFRDEDGAPGFLVHQAPCARHMLAGVDGVTRLIDLSSAHGRASSRAVEGPQRATVLAPEQRAGGTDLDPRCDIFLLGSALQEALARATRDDDQAPDHGAQCASLRAIAERATAPKRSERFWSADEMAYALQRAALASDLLASREEVAAWVRRLCAPASAPKGLPRVNALALAPVLARPREQEPETPRTTKIPEPPALPARVAELRSRAEPRPAPARPARRDTLPFGMPPPPVIALPRAPKLSPLRAPASRPSLQAIPPSPPPSARVTPLPTPIFAAPRESVLTPALPASVRVSAPPAQKSGLRRLGSVAGGLALLTGAFALGVRGFHDTPMASAARLRLDPTLALPALALASQARAEPQPIVTSLAPPPRARSATPREQQPLLTPRTPALPAPVASRASEPISEDEASASTIDTIAASIEQVSEGNPSSARLKNLLGRPRQLRSQLPENPY